jgi:hypothetical protein
VAYPRDIGVGIRPPIPELDQDRGRRRAELRRRVLPFQSGVLVEGVDQGRLDQEGLALGRYTDPREHDPGFEPSLGDRPDLGELLPALAEVRGVVPEDGGLDAVAAEPLPIGPLVAFSGWYATHGYAKRRAKADAEEIAHDYDLPDWVRLHAIRIAASTPAAYSNANQRVDDPRKLAAAIYLKRARAWGTPDWAAIYKADLATFGVLHKIENDGDFERSDVLTSPTAHPLVRISADTLLGHKIRVHDNGCPICRAAREGDYPEMLTLTGLPRVQWADLRRSLEWLAKSEPDLKLLPPVPVDVRYAEVAF